MTAKLAANGLVSETKLEPTRFGEKRVDMREGINKDRFTTYWTCSSPLRSGGKGQQAPNRYGGESTCERRGIVSIVLQVFPLERD